MLNTPSRARDVEFPTFKLSLIRPTMKPVFFHFRFLGLLIDNCSENSNLHQETREASVEASKKLREFGVEISMRKDLFDLVVAFNERGGCEGLTAEQKRFVEREIRSGKRNGLHLDDEKRKEITEIKKKMADLGTQGRGLS